MKELLKNNLEELGFLSAEFGVHNLRAGGATAAAGRGIPDRLFKKHGHWHLETVKDGYVEDHLEQCFLVTDQTGLQLSCLYVCILVGHMWHTWCLYLALFFLFFRHSPLCHTRVLIIH